MSFQENLKNELTYSGMIVKELSALSGINQSALNNYLSKRGQIPSIETGVKIACALGVSAESLVLGEGVAHEDIQLQRELRAITRLAKKLTSNKRKFAIEMLKLLENTE
jgi:transcriptional regulator with XRE-family HTH domain